jgi:hypothetical protein
MAIRKNAVYLDGEPQNLAAAAKDALDWLRLLQEHIRHVKGQTRYAHRLEEDKQRLQRTIDAIEYFLDGKPAIYKITGQPDLGAAIEFAGGEWPTIEGY